MKERLEDLRSCLEELYEAATAAANGNADAAKWMIRRIKAEADAQRWDWPADNAVLLLAARRPSGYWRHG